MNSSLTQRKTKGFRFFIVCHEKRAGNISLAFFALNKGRKIKGCNAAQMCGSYVHSTITAKHSSEI